MNYFYLTKVNEFRLKLYIKDFDTTKKFYAEVLQFPVVIEWNEEDHRGLMFDTGAGIIEFLLAKNDKISFSSTDISLHVEDVQKLWEYIQDKATIIFPLRKNDWGDTSFCIADPNGFHITFFTKTKV